MRPKRTKTIDPARQPARPTSAQARTTLLVLVCFLLGLGLGAYWNHRATTRPGGTVGESRGRLSEGTRIILQALVSPVEISFYSVLPPASAPEGLREFAERVDRLLAEYERAAGGKVKVSRFTGESGLAAARADGIKVFNLDQGDPCLLGAVLACDARREALPQFFPEWETALESDLSRAIARVTAPKPAARSSVADTEPVDPAVIAEVRRAIPNLNSVSLTEATQTLRVAALKEFADATEAMERAVRTAEERVQEAGGRGSEAERQAAVKRLEQVQAEHMQKLQQITARLQAQTEALRQIKQP